MTNKAIFAMGCFWGPQAFFDKLPGVTATRVGYTGGTKRDPTYTELGDHTEAIEVTFDPKKISYEQLLDHFWKQHDSTVPQKIQYRSAIFPLDETQRDSAESSLRNQPGQIQTAIDPAKVFSEAEDYHQKYFRKCGLA